MAEKAAPIHGAEMTKWTIGSPYRVYFRHALNSGVAVTLTYSFMAGYSEARLAYPKPKHIPAQVAFRNSVSTMARSAAPIIGTLAIFNLARGHYEQANFAKSQMDVRPLAYGLAFASVPFLASVLMKKPNPALGAGLAFAALDYTYDRLNITAVGPDTFSR